MCLKCGASYAYRQNKQRFCKSCFMPLTEIDEFIQPVIFMLNKKGYRTEYCCSCHLDDTISTYIMLHGEYEFKDMPKGFVLEDGHIIRRIYKQETPFSKSIDILTSLTRLARWAEKLPKARKIAWHCSY